MNFVVPDIQEGDRIRIARMVTNELLGSMAVGEQSAIYYNARIGWHSKRHGMRVNMLNGTVGEAIAPMTSGMCTFRYKSTDGKFRTEYFPKAIFERRPRFDVGQEVILTRPANEEMLKGNMRDVRADRFNDTASAYGFKFEQSKGKVTRINMQELLLTVLFDRNIETFFPLDCFELVEEV